MACETAGGGVVFTVPRKTEDTRGGAKVFKEKAKYGGQEREGGRRLAARAFQVGAGAPGAGGGWWQVVVGAAGGDPGAEVAGAVGSWPLRPLRPPHARALAAAHTCPARLPPPALAPAPTPCAHAMALPRTYHTCPMMFRKMVYRLPLP